MEDTQIIDLDSSSRESDEVIEEEPDPDPILIIYPTNSKSCITIRESDYDRLEPPEYLNDNLIDFFIKYFINESNKERILSFSSFFYASLLKSGYDNVLK